MLDLKLLYVCSELCLMLALGCYATRQRSDPASQAGVPKFL